MQLFFKTRQDARQFNAKRVASGVSSKVVDNLRLSVDNANKAAVVAPNRRFGVDLAVSQSLRSCVSLKG